MVELFMFALFALALDILSSFMSLPSLSIIGKLAKVESKSGRKVFFFAVQNNEREYIESREPFQISFSIRGTQQFVQGRSFAVYCGPDDEVYAEWLQQDKEILLRIPRMRPLKTWVFKCVVDPRTYEMGMLLRYPTRSRVRRILQRINERFFRYSYVEFHETKIVVREAQKSKSTKTRLSKALQSALPISVISIIVYTGFVWLFLGPFWPESSRVSFYLAEPISLWIDAALFAVGLCLIFYIATENLPPMAQGYLHAIWLNPEPPRSADAGQRASQGFAGSNRPSDRKSEEQGKAAGEA